MGAPKGHPPYPGSETGGAPRLFDTVEDFNSKADEYFNSLKPSEEWPHGQPATLTGLCLHLDTFPNVIRDYELGTYDSENQKFSTAVKKQRLRVVNFAERSLYTGKNAAGPIFHIVNLTRHAKDEEDKWKNAQHQEFTGPNGSALEITILSDRIKAARERSEA